MKKKTLQFTIITVLWLFFTACGQAPTLSPAATQTQTATSAPSATSEPSPTLTPTELPTVTPTSLPSPTPLPIQAPNEDDLVTIDATTASWIEQVAVLWSEALGAADFEFYPGTLQADAGLKNSFLLSFSGENKPALVLWNPQSSTSQELFTAFEERSQFNRIVVSPDGQWVAVAGIRRVMLGAVAHGSAPGDLAIAGQLVPTEDIDDPRAELLGLQAAFSRDSRLLAIQNGSGNILLWDVQAGRQVTTFSKDSGEGGNPNNPACFSNAEGLYFTVDGKTLISACYGKILAWDLSTFQDATVVDMKKSGSVFAINPEETILVTGHLDGAIDVWRFPSGSPQTKLTGQQRKITNLVFSPDGSLLASTSEDGTLDMWDTKTWRRLSSTGTYAGFLSFHPDGRFLVTGTENHSGVLWGVRDPALAAPRSGVRVILTGAVADLDPWRDAVPGEWLSKEGEFPRYEIRISTGWDDLETCNYGRQYRLTRRRATISVQITDLDTRSILASNTFRGTAPKTCPFNFSFSPYSLHAYLDGESPELEVFLPWLRNAMVSYEVE